jgi:hypothetical protein
LFSLELIALLLFLLSEKQEELNIKSNISTL